MWNKKMKQDFSDSVYETKRCKAKDTVPIEKYIVAFNPYIICRVNSWLLRSWTCISITMKFINEIRAISCLKDPLCGWRLSFSFDIFHSSIILSLQSVYDLPYKFPGPQSCQWWLIIQVPVWWFDSENILVAQLPWRFILALCGASEGVQNL